MECSALFFSLLSNDLSMIMSIVQFQKQEINESIWSFYFFSISFSLKCLVHSANAPFELHKCHLVFRLSLIERQIYWFNLTVKQLKNPVDCFNWAHDTSPHSMSLFVSFASPAHRSHERAMRYHVLNFQSKKELFFHLNGHLIEEQKPSIKITEEKNQVENVCS